ncbi:MAG TPA: hypothetical protein VL337_08095 [Acidimicrobiales bacterium]|jgi:hypothetical protein|nr:hypothetical protein [Acidimicrobiales bacterium]
MRVAAGRLSLLVLGATLCVVAVACGGSGKGSPTPVAAVAEPTTTTEPGAAYTACLRDHGVDVPDRPRRSETTVAGAPPSSRPPGTRPPGTRPSTTLRPGADPNAMQAARQACQSLQPADRGMQNPAFQVYASCLKDHGVVLADGGPGGPGGANRDDPAFKAADAICAPLRPMPPQS